MATDLRLAPYQVLGRPRLPDWLRARVQVPKRRDWYFVKLHAHGAPEDAHETLLGRPMVDFHESLAQYARENPWFHYHYVTAREMYNLAKAAESGWKGSVDEARDYELVWDSVASGRTNSSSASAAGEPRIELSR